MDETCRISVIVLADHFATIRRVVEHLCEQTVARDVELVIACPRAQEFGVPVEVAQALARVTVVEIPLLPMGPARAAAVRAARAPIVVLGETHAFPGRDWAERLVSALEGPWEAVAPGLENGNPDSARSWSAFLMDYGRYLAELTVGEIDEPPAYNAAWKREALLGFDDRMPLMLEPGAPLHTELAGTGAHFYREPNARVAHLNVARPVAAWAAERYWGGRLFGARRSRDWSLPRRLVYFAGSVLVPLIRFFRTRTAASLAGRGRDLPTGTLAAVAGGSLLWGVGEALGYVAGEGRAEARMLEYELHKERYA